MGPWVYSSTSGKEALASICFFMVSSISACQFQMYTLIVSSMHCSPDCNSGSKIALQAVLCSCLPCQLVLMGKGGQGKGNGGWNNQGWQNNWQQQWQGGPYHNSYPRGDRGNSGTIGNMASEFSNAIGNVTALGQMCQFGQTLASAGLGSSLGRRMIFWQWWQSCLRAVCQLTPRVWLSWAKSQCQWL